jgi:alkanesulfonate monooxygenase SsuD/methylene tetrahydromethanopterin reductase-like flavin-dependent oxidoreductase (luciferase family)
MLQPATAPLVSDPQNLNRMRLGFFTYLDGTRAPGVIYAEAMQLFMAATELEFDMVWVAQHHFGHHGGLPSPFVFLAAVAERAPRLGLGTAVVTLPLENSIRMAEDAAVFETLYPDRLQLGLGTGFASSAMMTTFGRMGQDRRHLYDEGIERVMDALRGSPINDDGDCLYPPAPALLTRLWEGPSTPERATEAGRRGSGLLLSRVAIGAGDRPTEELQIPLVEQYKASLPPGTAARIGLSRTVYPSRRPATAIHDLTAGLEVMAKNGGSQHAFPRERGLAGLFAHHNIHAGAPEAVIESLLQEPLLPQTTDLICQVQPGLPSLTQTLDALELIATSVAPALGWRSSRNEPHHP